MSRPDAAWAAWSPRSSSAQPLLVRRSQGDRPRTRCERQWATAAVTRLANDCRTSEQINRTCPKFTGARFAGQGNQLQVMDRDPDSYWKRDRSTFKAGLCFVGQHVDRRRIRRVRTFVAAPDRPPAKEAADRVSAGVRTWQRLKQVPQVSSLSARGCGRLAVLQSALVAESRADT